MFEYRRGNYAQALQLVPQDSAIELVDAPVRLQLKVTSHVLTAMALYRLHQTEQAKLELAQYRDIIETNFNGPLNLGSNTTDMHGSVGPWHDWWTAHILLREAEKLIEGAPTPETGAVPDGKTNAPAVDDKAQAN